MHVTKEEVGRALQAVGEQTHELDKRLSSIVIDLTTLKFVAAKLLEPDDPKRGLARIQEISADLAKNDPTAAKRKQKSTKRLRRYANQP
jgi:hypothetical protein